MNIIHFFAACFATAGVISLVVGAPLLAGINDGLGHRDRPKWFYALAAFIGVCVFILFPIGFGLGIASQ